MWQVSANLLNKMELARTPIKKAKYLNAAIDTICCAYSLAFPGRENEKVAD